VSELIKKHDAEVNGIVTFLTERVKAKVKLGEKVISIASEHEAELPSKDHLKVLLRKYLYKKDLKDDFRILAGKKYAFIIKERK
jgi:hypothetical protein